MDVTSASGSDVAAAARAALAIACALALLGIARFAAGLRADTWMWGFAPDAFLPALAGRALSLVPLLLLVPALGRLALRPIEALGRAAGSPARAALLGALVALVPVALLPDRLWFIGDFIVRQGATENAWRGEGSMFQAMPLDALLHNLLPRSLAGGSVERANDVLRIVGACEAALFGAVAGWSAFALGLRGAALIAGVCAVAGGGCLVVFTGLGKAAGLMCALALAVATLATRVARERRGLVALGFALSAALFVHRASVVLIPAWALACVAWWRAGGWRAPRGRDEALGGIALPVALGAFLAPRVVSLIARLDLGRHAGLGAEGGAPGWMATTLGAVRLADVANVLVALAPIAAVALAAAPVLARVRTGEKNAPLALLVGVSAALLLVVRPAQGIFRDWDVFAFAAAILSLEAARGIGATLERAPAWRWLLPALAAAALVPTFQWLLLAHDADRGAIRVRRFVEARPARPEPERAATWDFLASFYNLHARWPESAAAAEQAVRLAPSPRLVLEWGLASTRAGDPVSALAAFRLLVERSPRDPLGWIALLGAAERAGDQATARRAHEELAAHPLDAAAAARVRDYLARFPELAPRVPDASPAPGAR